MHNELIETILDQMFINKNANYTFESFPYNISVSEKIFELVSKDHQKSIEFLVSITQDELESLSDYMMEKCIKVFNYNNQYLSFDNRHKAMIKDAYINLLNYFKKHAIQNNLSKETIESIIFSHHKTLLDILYESNPDELKIQNKTNSTILPIVCSEYSENLQIDILKIDTKSIKQPILDIGCGVNANLVQYLRSIGIEAYGVERDFDGSCKYIEKEDWLDYKIKQNHFGTIISNMAFSNHFIRNHINNNPSAVKYAKKYKEILEGLKPNGEFIYAPSLPFIESCLPDGFSYEVINTVQTKFGGISVTKVTKIK